MSIRSLFCLHDYKTHAKKEYEERKMEVVKGTELWFSPKLDIITYSETIEVLICKKCGKVKKIVY